MEPATALTTEEFKKSIQKTPLTLLIYSVVYQNMVHMMLKVYFGHYIPYRSLAKQTGLHSEDNRLRK